MKRQYVKKSSSKCEIDKLADIWNKTKEEFVNNSGDDPVCIGIMYMLHDIWWDNYLDVCKKQIKQEAQSEATRRYMESKKEKENGH